MWIYRCGKLDLFVGCRTKILPSGRSLTCFSHLISSFLHPLSPQQSPEHLPAIAPHIPNTWLGFSQSAIGNFAKVEVRNRGKRVGRGVLFYCRFVVPWATWSQVKEMQKWHKKSRNPISPITQKRRHWKGFGGQLEWKWETYRSLFHHSAFLHFYRNLYFTRSQL